MPTFRAIGSETNVARKIAIFHGGDIWAENVENGVQFHVALKKYAEEEI